MASKTLKGNFIELTYNSDTFRIIQTKIELGDCLFAHFDEAASYITYKHIQTVAKDIKQNKESTIGLDLAPAHVYLEKSRVMELYEDFEKIIGEVQASLVWPEDLPMQ